MEFKRSETDKRRVVIVDFNHMAYAFAFGGAKALSSTLMVGGELQMVDTTIPAYSIKQLHRWACNGYNPLAVCFDGKGSTKSRKAYFAKFNGVKTNGDPIGYKASREFQEGKFYDGINLTANFLIQGGVSCYKAEGYEADDLIKACVDKAKVDYPDLPIDIVTGDSDMLPLVDEQVSVFLRSTKSTYAESPDIEKKHYVQVTHRNFQSYVEGLTDFKGLSMPYNTVLLKKLLRGKKGDDLAGKPDWKPKMYNMLLDLLIDKGYDLGELFRYDAPIRTLCYRDTQEPIPADLIQSTPRENMMEKYGEPPALTKICDAMQAVGAEPEDLVHVRYVYNGINLNGAFTGLPDGFNRRPATITSQIKGYDMVTLQKIVSALKINLPIV